MKTSDLGQPVFTAGDLIGEIYQGNVDKLQHCQVSLSDEDYIKYVQFVQDQDMHDWPLPEPYVDSDLDQPTFDHHNQSNWFMPDSYQKMDIEQYLIGLCSREEEVERVCQELMLYKKHNMMNVLRFLKYLVDIMRANNILWGVGRGSSVASFCLYLMGVHKIDSLRYCLDINEFLKGD